MLFNQKQIYGITTELIVAQKFIEKGYIVSIPYGNNSRYDMIVDTDKNCYRIQVKHASINTNGSYTVNTSNTVSTTAGNSRKYLVRNFMSGISRGIGIGIGFSIITALIVYVMQKIIRLNIPVLSQYISDIVEIVERTK